MAEAGKRYSAFISYNHRDRAWARWLHRSLETYRLPKHLRGGDASSGSRPARLNPVFLDREELSSSGDLAESVRAALEQADNLIVVCSPASAASRWVNEEIRSFRVLNGDGHIFCLIVDGEPHAAAQPGVDPALECFPPALFEESSSAREPLAADVRQGQDGRTLAKLKLLAGLLGIGFDELRRRDAARRQRRLIAIATAASVGFLIMAVLTTLAIISRQQAVAARSVAEQKTRTAQRTADFIKSLFAVSDPSEARGNSITAREILDRGARQIESGLRDEPLVQAELATTLGEVYTSLGLYQEGAILLTNARSVPDQQSSVAARQFAALGEVRAYIGDYAEAEAFFRRALQLAKTDDVGSELQPRVLIGLGEVMAATDRYDESRRMISDAYTIAARQNGPINADVARALEALGFNEADNGNLAGAEQLFRRATDIRVRTAGRFHPRVSENLSQLGSLAYLGGDVKTAEHYFERALRIDARVLGERHPDLASTLQNLGRMKLEQRDFAGALPLLERAVAINLAQRSETHDDMAFFFANLALAKQGVGDRSEAEPLFHRALKAAELHGHRNLAPILTELADLECSSGRVAEGLARLDKAEPIMRRTYPDEEWRIAHVESVRGSCLIASDQVARGRELIDENTPILLERWGPNSLYGGGAIDRRADSRA